MLTLLTYPAGFGQFSLSPFCVKSAYLLQISGQKWQREDLKDPRKMPHQKLPVLKTDQGLIAESEAIRAFLETKGTNFDPGLTDPQKACARGLIRMAEDHLYFHLVLDRWINDDVWPTVREQYFDAIPGFLRKFVTNGIRKGLIKGLATQGLIRLSAQERTDRLELDLHALTTLLSQSAFLFGDQPTGADFSVAAVLGAMKSTPVRTNLVKRIASDPVLDDYLTRMTQTVPLP